MVHEHLWKKSFPSPRVPLWNHQWLPPCTAGAAPRLHPVTTGQGPGVSLGDAEGWKPHNVAVCGWTRCPQVCVLRHVAKIRPVLRQFETNCAHRRPFVAIFGPFLIRIALLEGSKGLFVTRKSRRTWSVRLFPFVRPL